MPAPLLTPAVAFKVRVRRKPRGEYGYLSGETATYSRDSGGSIEVNVYRMKDPSGAYGLYSYLRTPEMAHSGPNDHSVMSRDEELVLWGISCSTFTATIY